MQSAEFIGQFSNIKLAGETTQVHCGAVVLDVSKDTHQLVYKDGRLLERSE